MLLLKWRKCIQVLIVKILSIHPSIHVSIICLFSFPLKKKGSTYHIVQFERGCDQVAPLTIIISSPPFLPPNLIFLASVLLKNYWVANTRALGRAVIGAQWSAVPTKLMTSHFFLLGHYNFQMYLLIYDQIIALFYTLFPFYFALD